ncbi:MAG: cytochrome c oxidase assembly protein [Pararhizobium sp.]
MQQSAEMKRRNRLVLLCSLGVVGIMIALVAVSPILYRDFVSYIGYGATLPQTERTMSLTHEGIGEKVTVRFDTNVASGLDWTFRPEKPAVTADIGAPKRVYFDVTNNSGKTIVVQTTFNVTPDWAAPYFFKVEDFCLPTEKLRPGESARMPLVFYVDRRLVADRFAGTIPEVTLSYTFFRRPGLSAAAMAAVPDLHDQAATLDQKMAANGTAIFVNDAPTD